MTTYPTFGKNCQQERKMISSEAWQEILEGQLATQLTKENDYRTDFWEFLPAGQENDFFGSLAKILQSQLATQLTKENEYKASFCDILQKLLEAWQRISKVSSLTLSKRLDNRTCLYC